MNHTIHTAVHTPMINMTNTTSGITVSEVLHKDRMGHENTQTLKL